MGLLKNRVNVTSFVVEGALPPGWRESYRERIEGFSFRGPYPPEIGKWSGWCHVNDELELEFENFNAWLTTNYIALGMRIDTYSVPAAAVRRKLKKRVSDWCEANGAERCPRAYKKEWKDEIQRELVRQIPPKTKVIEFIWDLDENTAAASTHSDSEKDRLRMLFHRTFGRRLVERSPLSWLDAESSEQLLISPPIYFT
jgi:hypothetical protein